MSTHQSDYEAMLEGLKRAREAAGLRQADVARIFGRPQSFVSKIETGERHLDPIELQRLAELYGHQAQDFIAARPLPDPTRAAHDQPEHFKDVLRPARSHTQGSLPKSRFD